LFSERPGWKTLRAVRNHCVFTVPDIDSAVRPGPRILEGIREIQTVVKAAKEAKSPVTTLRHNCGGQG
ncbi:MAG: hypothetical protein IKO55_06615, partial [Kiritimatiellae bacterium]|nr:hypothetical protein [Kiritimatiellia bacterium]